MPANNLRENILRVLQPSQENVPVSNKPAEFRTMGPKSRLFTYGMLQNPVFNEFMHTFVKDPDGTKWGISLQSFELYKSNPKLFMELFPSVLAIRVAEDRFGVSAKVNVDSQRFHGYAYRGEHPITEKPTASRILEIPKFGKLQPKENARTNLYEGLASSMNPLVPFADEIKYTITVTKSAAQPFTIKEDGRIPYATPDGSVFVIDFEKVRNGSIPVVNPSIEANYSELQWLDQVDILAGLPQGTVKGIYVSRQTALEALKSATSTAEREWLINTLIVHGYSTLDAFRMLGPIDIMYLINHDTSLMEPRFSQVTSDSVQRVSNVVSRLERTDLELDEQKEMGEELTGFLRKFEEN